MAAMTTLLTRREFVHAGAATLAVAQSSNISPTMLVPGSAKPLVIASANGNKFMNGGSRAAVATAFARIVEGKDVLDAVVEGVSLNELDPEDDSVGYGGLPNAEGVVQLDSCCMHGPLKRAGGVACLEGIR
jgi:N4-(beta-N-acetylglucosaminyl)-L-asparaginase